MDVAVISKAEFARRRGVSPGRVSQWISEGKIGGDALVGEGRNAQINEAVAVGQLRKKLDPMQMTANGLSTRLDAPAPIDDTLPLAAPVPAAAPMQTVGNSLEEQIKRQRLEQLERANREGQREEALKAGQLTDVTIARQIAGRETSRLVTLFEGSLSNFANAISAEFKLPHRDVLHLLRGEFRKFRAEAAATARTTAEALPPMAEIELAPAEVEEDETEAA